MSFACSDKTTFEKVDCDPNYKSENHNLKKIFKPCREFYYSAKFWNTDKTLVSDEVVKITATGKDWMHQTDRQDEIVIQFQSHSISDISTIESGSINPDLKGWVNEYREGIVESEDESWIHPVRMNQYAFTELAPFPQVRFPISMGKTWNTDFSIHEGWGKWAHTDSERFYEVVANEEVITNFKKINSWKVYSYSRSKFGIDTNTFWFNDEYGFVKMIIENYAGQVLMFELIDVIDG